MKRLTWLLAVALVVVMMSPAFAAPLFPDVPEQHWARDAVADLAAKGILEGYPDGTFKGDRAATRWEMAMALQRFLAKMEAEHAKFATKADLEALRALVNNLKDELDALGVRVKNLEENVSALDKRVTELERITFGGDFVTRLVTVGIQNTGRTGTTWNNDVGGLAGLTPGVLIPGSQPHKLGTIDMMNGRPLVNGTGFTARANFNVKVKVSQDLKAGITFSAFTSLGDRYLDAYWGVSAPYLSNVFAGNSYSGLQPINNSVWTRMTLDNFWIEHTPTGTKLIAGAIRSTKMDDFILHNVPNPGIDGRDKTHFADVSKEKKTMVSSWKYYENADSYLPFYGIQVSGKTHFITDFTWEAMYSKLPDDPFQNGLWSTSAVTPANNMTVPYLVSITGGWKIKDQGLIRLNFMRVSENFNDGQTTSLVANRGNFWGWTDPYDRRFDKTVKMPMRGNTGISQQGQTSYGLSINYRFDPSNIRVVGVYGGTDYRPNLESGYSVQGNHFRLGIGWTDKKEQVDLDLEYISTDPYYDAFQLYYQPVGAMLQGGLPNSTLWMSLPNMSYVNFGYQLHDSDLYPNNRQGIKFGGEYRFSNGNGRINLRLGFLTQTTNSAPHRDINNLYNGWKPGFIDPVFTPLAANGLTGAAARVFESPKGNANNYGGGIEYKFSPSALKASVQYDYNDFKRNTSYANTSAIAQNNRVDLRYQALKIGLAYAFSDKFTLRGGYNYSTLCGYHPYLNDFNARAGNDVVNQYQTMPYIGFDYDLGKDTQWTFDFRVYNTVDEMSRNVRFASKESFGGIQMMTQFKVKF